MENTILLYSLFIISFFFKDKQVKVKSVKINIRMLLAWDLLMGRMGVKDAWYVLKKPRSSLCFSRAGCNMFNGFCMSCIDRIYISSELEKYGSNVEIIAGSTYSDHMPVTITLVN